MRRPIRGTIRLAATLSVCLPLQVSAANIELPDGQGRDLVYGNCRTCHDLQYLKESAGISSRAWGDILDSMRQYGLRLEPDVRGSILEYLTTYLGPNPPPATAAKPADTGLAVLDGKALFGDNCVACHQEEGQGVAGQFPPLAGNPDIFASTEFPAIVALHGLQGPISVGGKEYNGEMPPFDHLSDAEIAAVVGYIRSSWGNDKNRPKDFRSINTDDVKVARENTMTPEAVHALRAGLVKQ
ncbi:MAG: cytochrome c [Rhodobiaceae bacterium]|nr:cytochrome c [Rhodobiaceae bacterium]MCC0056075.1 cytochrome c [Rhodobiaceae bacterium]